MGRKRKKQKGPKAPTIAEQHQIDEQAKRLFPTRLPPDWLIRKRDPDYFVDYQIEIGRAGEPTGLEFGVQLKGQGMKQSQDAFFRDLETKHIRYWLNNYRLPLFVFLVDTQTQSIRWLFVQKWAKSLPKEKVSSQGTIRAHFPRENDLSDTIGLMAAVEAALVFMQELRPGSIQAALAQRKSQLESKDPRFNVSIDVLAGVNHVTITPATDKPITLSLRIRSERALEKMMGFIEAGTDTEFGRNEVELVGSPLLEVGDHPNSLIKLTAADKHDTEVVVHLEHTKDPIVLRGTLVNGTRYFGLSTASPSCPLDINLKMPINQDGSIAPGSGRISISFSSWENRDIRSLPYLEILHNLSKTWIENPPLSISVRIHGNRVIEGKIQTTGNLFLARQSFLLDALFKLSVLVRRLGKSVILPSISAISPEMADDIAVAYALSLGGQYVEDYPDCSIEIKLLSLNKPTPLQSRGSLRVENEFVLNAFGTEVFRHRVCSDFRNVELAEQTTQGDRHTLVFKGCSTTLRRITLAS